MWNIISMINLGWFSLVKFLPFPWWRLSWNFPTWIVSNVGRKICVKNNRKDFYATFDLMSYRIVVWCRSQSMRFRERKVLIQFLPYHLLLVCRFHFLSLSLKRLETNLTTYGMCGRSGLALRWSYSTGDDWKWRHIIFITLKSFSTCHLSCVCSATRRNGMVKSEKGKENFLFEFPDTFLWAILS